MPLVTCRMCRKVYNSSLNDKRICSQCRKKLDELYLEVRSYLRDNSNVQFNVETLADAIGASVGDMQVLVDLGYLERDILDDSAGVENVNREKLAKEFEESLNKMREAMAAKKSVSYGQDLYGGNVDKFTAKRH